MKLESIDRWFDRRGWEVFAFQRETWQAMAEGASGIVHSATGTGKTLAVWGGFLQQARADHSGHEILWITPLRALANDTAHNLNAPLPEDAPWRVQVRTGDTSQSERARQRRKPPRALVTTPESLALMLSYKDASERLGNLSVVVVDEWHELLGNKRGVLLELALARLRRLNPALRIWGLSATLGNLDQALTTLLGMGHEGRLIEGARTTTVHIETILPASVERFAWAGHLGLKLLPQVIERLQQARSSLLFTNTRSQAELWFNAIAACWPDGDAVVGLHHGSIDRALRDRVEDGLRTGSMRVAIATSSLDLGIDFSPVEQVLQVGSPKGVARLLQRAGRANHRPDQNSTIVCVPTHALELAEIAAARRSIERGEVEARQPLQGCLDVLAQHLITLAVGGGFEANATLTEIRTTSAFASLSDEHWAWVLDFVVRGGRALDRYPDFAKVERDGEQYKVNQRRVAYRHRLAIGTITSDSAMTVRWKHGGTLGQLEESFVAKLQPGQKFLFAGKLLELVRVRDLTAYVRRAKGKHSTVPRWQGGRLPLSSKLAHAVQALFSDLDTIDSPELTALAPLLEIQQRWSALPTIQTLLVETSTTRAGTHYFFYPFAGRLVHQGLAAVVAHRLAREKAVTFSFSINDYGFELLSRNPPALDELRIRQLFSAENLLEDILASLNAAQLAKKQFRDISRIAGLVFAGMPGQHKPMRHLQASSSLIYDMLAEHDPENPFLAQAQGEVLEAELELGRLEQTLADIEQREIRLCETPKPTPMAFPLLADRLMEELSSEDFRTRMTRLAEQAERAAQK